MRVCKLEECDTKHRSSGYCNRHYQMWKLNGDPRINRRVVHGKIQHPLYRTWTAMKYRCSNSNSAFWKSYGGRGIRVCTEWQESFKTFLEDVGERPGKRYTLDRIDNDGDYEPDNVRWATQSQQNINRRIQSNNTSGYPGIKVVSTNSWSVTTKWMGKVKYWGTYHEFEEALSARLTAEAITQEAGSK